MNKLALIPLFTLLFVISTVSVSATPDDDSMMHNKMMEDHSANIPIYIPLTMGYVDGNEVFYISTEASIEKIANDLTILTGFPVTYTPELARVPESALAEIYVFSNGIKGIGALGFQPNVADSEPGDEGYSPLWNVNVVTWTEDASVEELKSEEAILDAVNNGKLSIEAPGLVVNCPFIKWSDGQMQIRENMTLTDDTSYGGGQILEINTEEGYVVFVGHKGYFDNKVIFYIATDASAEGPAGDLGIPLVPKLSETLLLGSSDLVVFTNGIEGVGPAGFQPSIGSTNIGDEFYSPLWRILKATWANDTTPIEIMSFEDVSAKGAQGDVTISTPEFVVNCPFIDVKALHHDDDYMKMFGEMMMMEDNMMMGDEMMMEDNMMMGDEMMMEDNMMMGDEMMMEDNMMMGDEMMMEDNMMMGDEMMMEDNMMMGDEMMMEDNMMMEVKSPKKQMEKYNVKPMDVVCGSDKELAFKVSDNSAVCLTPTTTEILMKRGIVTQ